MKKRCRKVRPVFVYMIGMVGILLAVYGALWHRYPRGSVCFIGGCVVWWLSICLLEKKFEVKQ